MRVAILSRQFPPQISGIGDHTDLMAEELARRGAHPTVLCSPPADSRASYEVQPVIPAWDGRGFGAIISAVRGVKPDVVLWQYNPFSVGRRGIAPRVGVLARRLVSAAPLVLFLHELWFPWGREGLRGLVWAGAQRAQARPLLAAATRWIVTTERRENELRRLDPSKVVRIPVGSNVVPCARSGGARTALGIPEQSFVVAHLGSVGPGRDLEPAFGAIASLRRQGIDARLLLAGRTGSFRAPADVPVHLTGVAPRESLSAALGAADVYVHPDHAGPSAGRRTTIVAALAHGLPVVSYRGADHASELVDRRNVVLSDAAPEALARELAALASDPHRRAELGQAAREAYDAHFSWTRIGERLMHVLTSVT